MKFPTTLTSYKRDRISTGKSDENSVMGGRTSSQKGWEKKENNFMSRTWLFSWTGIEIWFFRAWMPWEFVQICILFYYLVSPTHIFTLQTKYDSPSVPCHQCVSSPGHPHVEFKFWPRTTKKKSAYVWLKMKKMKHNCRWLIHNVNMFLGISILRQI